MTFDPNDEFEDLPDLNDYPTLVSVVRFNKLLPAVNWFRSVGLPMGAATLRTAEFYVETLGFPGTLIAPIDNWEDAAYAAANPDFNSLWWETEEQIRVGLTASALELISEEDLTAALTHISATASPLIQNAVENLAEEEGIEDEELIRAAIGSGIQTCHQAALVLAAGEEDTHPFALKYKLFELGRWPIAITGSSFNLF
ncbi:hypothetical protein [Sneathiella glossodoripedis]|uniref:hypothetical protein n=1 Tax=Sneathiella glossodoripedis TaxID=418853 RepID=UPI000471799E|nr:hypothetical protein [Sneathiella glossodoripedis]